MLEYKRYYLLIFEFIAGNRSFKSVRLKKQAQQCLSMAALQQLVVVKVGVNIFLASVYMLVIANCHLHSLQAKEKDYVNFIMNGEGNDLI